MEIGVFEKAKPLEFANPVEKYALPVYYFTHLSRDEQLEICTKLAQSARRDHMYLAYELGYGNSLSPVDSAGADVNRAVLAFDVQGQTTEKLVRGTDTIKIPTPESNSFAAFFKLDFKSLPGLDGLPKADIAYSIAPFPNSFSEIANVGLQIANEVFIVSNPDKKLSGPIEQILPGMPSGVKPEILMLNKSEVESHIGTSSSAFLGGIQPGEKIPVIHIK